MIIINPDLNPNKRINCTELKSMIGIKAQHITFRTIERLFRQNRIDYTGNGYDALTTAVSNQTIDLINSNFKLGQVLMRKIYVSNN
jgi:hypothetical protein